MSRLPPILLNTFYTTMRIGHNRNLSNIYLNVVTFVKSETMQLLERAQAERSKMEIVRSESLNWKNPP